MNTHPIADRLAAEIDRHAAGVPVGKLESHDLASLCRRVLLPRDAVEKLLSSGALRSEGLVHANDETGRHSFTSDNLNEVRRAALAALVERVVDESDGDPAQVSLAAGHALREHVASFRKPAPREFSRFPVGVVQFARFGEREDEAGPVRRTAAAVGKAAAVGGLAYGAASFLRGRRPGLNPLQALRAGHTANAADLKKIAQRAGRTLSPGAARVAAALAGRRVG